MWCLICASRSFAISCSRYAGSRASCCGSPKGEAGWGVHKGERVARASHGLRSNGLLFRCMTRVTAGAFLDGTAAIDIDALAKCATEQPYSVLFANDQCARTPTGRVRASVHMRDKSVGAGSVCPEGGNGMAVVHYDLRSSSSRSLSYPFEASSAQYNRRIR